ncbi:MAG: insulinase family protein [Anaerolineae bacterium]
MTTTIHGFELIREEDIPEIRARARLFRHTRTGAELLSLENDDENKVFGITFRTPVSDSTGVPHIMEHSVLCGSRKYPVKEPFIQLAKGSLKTFLNAFTYPDKTCYPVASQNVQDLYNLMDVYLDAVFHPLIPPQTLDQEGWHYELENVADPLKYKGVVFNEMKGVYSSADGVLYDTIQQSLFPDTTYFFDSGGDPARIPDLTYAQFKGFHETFYHPSNARIFFYGDDHSDERLRRVDEYLRDYERRDVPSEVQLQPRFTAPREVATTYPIGEETDAAKKSIVTINWMLDEIQDTERMLALEILDHALLGSLASPVRKALIDSGLGEEVAGGGLATHLRQATFSAGLKGVAPEAGAAVEAVVLDTLARLAREGIDPAMIEASLNTIEFHLRENNTGQFPRGISLMLTSLSAWLHDGDPLAPLKYEAPLAGVKARLASGERLFEGLIEAYFLNNPHRIKVAVHPDRDLTRRAEEAEAARLAQVRAGLSDADLAGLVAATHELQRLQETPDAPEALATIPSLKLSDLERENKPIPSVVTRCADTEVLYHDLFTNGIVYLDLGMDMHALPQHLLPYAPLFGRALLEMGTQTEDYVRLAQRIGSKTGGIWRQFWTTMPKGGEQGAARLFLRGKATVAQADELLRLLHDILLTANFDNQARFQQMVLESKARQESGIIHSGSGVVMTRLAAHFSEADWLDEQIGGLTHLFFVRDLAKRVESDWPSVLAALEEIRQLLVNRAGMILNVTLDSENWAALQPRLETFLASLPMKGRVTAAWNGQAAPAPEGLVIPGQVNYVGKAANIYAAGYRYHGSIAVINRYLRTMFLWDRVRIQGGAYGASSGFSRRTGVYSFSSYRDPNLVKTLQNYDETAAYLRTLELDEMELEKTIIGAIGDLDAYRLPDAKGWIAMDRHLAGDTDAELQQIREEILATSAHDFRAFADALDSVAANGLVVVLGSQAAIDAANRERDGWLRVTNVGI